MNRHAVLFAVLASLASSPAVAQVILDESGAFGPEPSSEVRRFTVDVRETTETPMLQTTVTLSQGKVTVRVTDPAGEKVFESSTSGSMQLGRQPLGSGCIGTYHVEVVPEKAVGTWSVRVSTDAQSWPIALYLVPGVGMGVVGAGAVLLWRLWSRARWRWFWVGAAVWTVGVFLKFAFAIPLNKPILGAIENAAPHNVYLALGSIYIGLLTGVFEIGVTLVAALVWKKMTRDAACGVAVGVGAGAFEAVLLGAMTVLGIVAALAMGGETRDQIVAAMAASAATTPLLWLVAPVERIIAILCHVSSRALVLLGVARGRWFWPFVAGFLIMTAIDAVAGYVYLAGLMGKISVWWIELAIAPAALLSIPILVWCIRNWPDRQPAAPVAAASGDA
ncbi:MAG: YhfC family glutamic-type intramembrane protease [Planctomycetia bacterium]|nr:YhfC family glutamic-type intramembrane protease [Planctomycetia bacterium]